jgi:hypothetical protein
MPEGTYTYHFDIGTAFLGKPFIVTHEQTTTTAATPTVTFTTTPSMISSLLKVIMLNNVSCFHHQC